MTHGGIYQLINLRQQEIVFRACLAQISEIHAYSPLPVSFFYQYNVEKPGSVVNHPYKAYL